MGHEIVITLMVLSAAFIIGWALFLRYKRQEMRHKGWLSILSMLVAATVAAQDNPDFSGRWMLETSAGAGPDVALFLTVRQPVVRTNVYGAPMPPKGGAELSSSEVSAVAAYVWALSHRSGR